MSPEKAFSALSESNIEHCIDQLRSIFWNEHQRTPTEQEEHAMISNFRAWCGGRVDLNRLNEYWAARDPFVMQLAQHASDAENSNDTNIIARIRSRVADLLLWPWKQYLRAWMCDDV